MNRRQRLALMGFVLLLTFSPLHIYAAEGAEIPQEEEIPQGEEASAEEETPQGEEASAEDEIPQGEEASAEEETPQGEETSAEEEIPQGEEASAEEETPQGEETSAEEEIPQGEETSAEDEDPQGEETSTEEQDPQEEELPPGVAVDEESFPDGLFRAYVSEHCDSNRDGILTDEELAGITKIKLTETDAWFESLEGIEYFTALKSLRFEGWYGMLRELDLSGNPALEELYLHRVEVRELNLSKNSRLRSLTCSDMPGALAEGLDISKNTRLEELDLYLVDPIGPVDVSRNTALKSLSLHMDVYAEETNHFDRVDVTKNRELESLSVSIKTGREVGRYQLKLNSLDLTQNRKLKELAWQGIPVLGLDVSQNIFLEKLIFTDSGLTKLELGKNENLKVLDCRGNALSELDISRNVKLEQLICSNNHIGYLNLAPNTKLKSFFPGEVVTESGFPVGERNLIYLPEPSLDLSNYPDLDRKRLSKLENLALKGDILTVKDPSKPAGYRYSCGENLDMEVAVAVDEERATAANYQMVFSGNGADGGHVEALKGCRPDRAYTFPANAFVREGYIFTGWNSKPDGSGSSYSDQATVRNLLPETGTTVTLYAQWQKEEGSVNQIVEKEFIFTDVPVIPENWKYESIRYVYNRGFMGNVGSSSQFQPGSHLTRAMFATVLYRMAGEPTVSFRNRFTDVERGKWYSDAIFWVSDMGIVHGYSDGSYGINDNVTREQMAKMLYLFGLSRGYEIDSSGSLKGFADSGKVSGWAVGYMQWAVKAGLISGKPREDGSFRLDPKGEAARSECAKMLMVFWQKYEAEK